MFGVGTRDYLPTSHRRALRDAVDELSRDLIADTVEALGGLDFADSFQANLLPRKYLPRYTSAFAKRFLVCLLVVAWTLRVPTRHWASCVAEELALGAVVRHAGLLLRQSGETPDFGLYEDTAFDDLDFEFLYQLEMDGFEDDDVGRYLSMANLRFDLWLRPFYLRYVHPYVDDESQPDQPPPDKHVAHPVGLPPLPVALTPHHLATLRRAVCKVTDDCFTTLLAMTEWDDVRGLPMARHLPRGVLSRFKLRSAEKFLACVVIAAWKLLAPTHVPLACPGETLALRAVLQQAEMLHASDGATPAFVAVHARFPELRDVEGLVEGSGAVAIRVRDLFSPYRADQPAHPFLTQRHWSLTRGSRGRPGDDDDDP